MISAPSTSIMFVFEDPIPVSRTVVSFVPTLLFHYESSEFSVPSSSFSASKSFSMIARGPIPAVAFVARKIVGLLVQEIEAILVVFTWHNSLVFGFVGVVVPVFHVTT